MLTSSSSVSFQSEGISFSIKQKKLLKNWIIHTILSENKTIGDIAFVYCNDEYLLTINNKYLNHDTYTDVITFENSEGNIISGDILISIERVKENAAKFNVNFKDELNRVMIHGVLHLLGYKDKNTKNKEEIRRKEDYYLSLRTF